MNDLVVIEDKEPVTTTMLIAKGVGNKHENVMELLVKHSLKTKILSGFETRKVSSGGRPMTVGILNEKQATFLITLMRNSEKVLEFKEKLVDEFFDMRDRLQKVALNHQNQEWQQGRKNSIGVRNNETDVIRSFVEYATSQGSTSANRYYSNISSMENRSLWILEGKFKNVREMLSGHQLSVIANADLIAARSLIKGMEEGMHYKDIYQMAKNDVEVFSNLIGKSVVPMVNCDSIEYLENK
jgi:phage regulator Rha-like protein